MSVSSLRSTFEHVPSPERNGMGVESHSRGHRRFVEMPEWDDIKIVFDATLPRHIYIIGDL
ncbi:MAG: hypothetical protein R2825_29150 [Saprospiraceae bacterium]